MKFVAAVAAVLSLTSTTVIAAPDCDVPPSFVASDNDAARVSSEITTKHRLDIAVVGTGSSTLPGPDGANFAYPARLQEALRLHLPGNEIKVVTHVQSRQTTANMAVGLKKILQSDNPALVVWQAGTFDAVSGIEPDEFGVNLQAGVDTIRANGADVDLLNMQYSPRTESLLNVSAYAEVMRWVAQEHGTLLFDRLALMRYWDEQGIFNLYAATKKSDMARHVHACIGRALAFQIINAAHLMP